MIDCPKCDGKLVERSLGLKIKVRRCDECGGMFCRADVLAAMKTEWMSEVLDPGDPAVGRKYDAVAEISCPECSVPMQHKSDPDQTHIHYEECRQCGGVFFDAGEFSDWKYETFFDRVRDALAERRS